jgi:hypothetical protein
MRAFKSVLVMAVFLEGRLDSHSGKMGVDLFPGIEIVKEKQEYLVNAASAVEKELGLQATSFILENVIQNRAQ